MEEAALIAADPERQTMYRRPDASLCVRHAPGDACWAPRPDITAAAAIADAVLMLPGGSTEPATPAALPIPAARRSLAS